MLCQHIIIRTLCLWNSLISSLFYAYQYFMIRNSQSIYLINIKWSSKRSFKWQNNPQSSVTVVWPSGFYLIKPLFKCSESRYFVVLFAVDSVVCTVLKLKTFISKSYFASKIELFINLSTYLFMYFFQRNVDTNVWFFLAFTITILMPSVFLGVDL